MIAYLQPSETPPKQLSRRRAWSWVPSLYFAEGIPYIVVMQLAVIMYKRFGISNTEIALYTSWLYLPWVIKPFWSPIVDTLRTKRFWILAMQLVIGAGLAGVALTLPGPMFFRYSLAFLWLLAFSSATHDIAADGFYMLGLSENDQAWFVGIRSTFYRLAMITGQGLLVILAGGIESSTGLPTHLVEVQAVRQEAPVFEPPLAGAFGEGASGQDATFLSYPETVLVGLGAPQPRIDSLLAAARAWNRTNGFVEVEEPVAAEPGLWQRTVGAAWSKVVKAPLERLLRSAFDVPSPGSLPSGPVGLAWLRVSEAGVESPIVVNVDITSGDRNLGVAEGARLRITPENAALPAAVVFQADPRLDEQITAVFEVRSGNVVLAWATVFVVIAILFGCLATYHKFVLPRPFTDVPTGTGLGFVRDFLETFASFFRKKGIGVIVTFILLYRFSEAQLVKLAAPFLLDTRDVGGMALTTGEVGFIYGTVGVLALTLGGIVGGIVASRDGLKRWFWPMIVAMNLPNAVYLYMATALPESFVVVNACVAVEQFGYGFGFTAFLLFLIMVSEGKHKTAHYAICTGLMAAGMMIPGMFSGWLQDIVGYHNFFVWILVATIPAFVISAFVRIDPEFGKRRAEPE